MPQWFGDCSVLSPARGQVNVFLSFVIHKGFTTVVRRVAFFRSVFESPAGRQNIPDSWIQILWERIKKKKGWTKESKHQRCFEKLHFTRGKPTPPLRMLDYGGIPAVVGRAWHFQLVILGMKQHKKTNNLGVLPLRPRRGHSYLTKGYTLLYAAKKASLSDPSWEQWGPASGKQDHLHAAVCRFQDHKGQSKEP